jgi:TrmH family RNA methyltransferase
VDAIIAAENSASPYLRRAVRNSMGTVFSLPVFHTEDIVDLLSALRTRYGTRIIASSPGGESSADAADLRGNICIVAGNEDEGISEDVLRVSDLRVGIPMDSGTDSLNVSSAMAVLLYEARRQRLRP